MLSNSQIVKIEEWRVESEEQHRRTERHAVILAARDRSRHVTASATPQVHSCGGTSGARSTVGCGMDWKSSSKHLLCHS